MRRHKFDQINYDRVLRIGLWCYFFVQLTGMLAFQFVWSKDVAIFGSFWEAGRHLDYERHPLVWVTEAGVAETNLNPPALLPAFQLFALFEPQVGQMLWLGISAVIYAVCVIYLDRNGIHRLGLVWLLTTPLAYIGIGLGQIYVLLVALGVLIWAAMREGQMVTAAVLVGILVAMKPNFAVWGFLAFAAGHYRPAIVAGLVAALLSILPVLLYGSEIYGEWFAAMAEDNHNLFPHDVSINGFLIRLGIDHGIILAILGFLASVMWAAQVRPSLYALTPAAIIISMLVAPLAWIDYLLIASPWLVTREWGKVEIAAFALTYFIIPAGWATDNGHTRILFIVSVACILSVMCFLFCLISRIKPRLHSAPTEAGAIG